MRLRNVRIVFLCLILSGLSACAMFQGTIFQRDPTGASLVTLRNGYESAIKESGRAYQAGAITKEQLNQIVQVGRNFYSVYGLAVNAHLLQQEQDTEKYRLQAAALLAQLTDLARSMFGYTTSS